MVKVEVVKQSRLNGVDVMPGETVVLEHSLAVAWLKTGRARAAREMVDPPEPDEVDLKKLSIKKLKALAAERGIELPDQGFSKQDLIELLSELKEPVIEENPPADETNRGN